MADDTATLKDALASDQPTAQPKADATPAEPEITAPRIVEAPNPDAAEIGNLILQSGFSKEQLNDLLQAPRQIEALGSMLKSNPQEFLNYLQRSDPASFENMLDAASDRFLKMYGSKEPRGNSKEDSTSDLMREVQALREETTSLKTAEQRRQEAAAWASTRQRYEARVDDLFGNEAVKKVTQTLGMTKADEKNLRARLNSELGSDPSAVQRISQGNFVDVPKTFQGIIEEWVNDKKSSADEAKAQRERTSKNAFAEFMPGANLLQVDIPQTTFDSWDATESGFASALERTAR